MGEIIVVGVIAVAMNVGLVLMFWKFAESTRDSSERAAAQVDVAMRLLASKGYENAVSGLVREKSEETRPPMTIEQMERLGDIAAVRREMDMAIMDPHNVGEPD